ncbi:MAG TPA: carbohydrate ABC transporter substrate-binding protein, partial [Candidatus Nocardiopsis merdipullorum]|nr:carbohydrate ABC transporter substrate-binding protein [Candidatus Nocardiopsis merdipullorum]
MVATACGDDSGGSEEVNLRFSWWGADDRHATIQQVIENFEAENPDIRIT